MSWKSPHVSSAYVGHISFPVAGLAAVFQPELRGGNAILSAGIPYEKTSFGLVARFHAPEIKTYLCFRYQVCPIRKICVKVC